MGATQAELGGFSGGDDQYFKVDTDSDSDTDSDERVMSDRSEGEFGTTVVPDIITTAIGGEGISQTVSETEVLLGYESDRTRPPQQYTVEFVDWPFNNTTTPSFEDHLATVKREEPMYAVAPDIEDVDPQDVIYMADQLDQHVTQRVIVVPKDIHPSEVPERFRVGVPFADFGSDAPWQWDDYTDAGDLHLLGGTPHKQLNFAKRVSGVRSVDGATVINYGRLGDVWGPHKNRKWHETGQQQMDFYERVGASFRNIVEAWKAQIEGRPGDYEIPTPRDEYDELVDYIDQQIEIEQKDTKVERRYRRSGTRGADRFIHPDDADCLRSREREQFDIIDFEQRLEQDAERAERIVVDRHNPGEQTGLDQFAAAD